MNPSILWALVAVIFVLLFALLAFEKRRQRQRARFERHLEELERQGDLDELEEILAEEEAIDRESSSQAFMAFVRGRPTRFLTASGIFSIIHGIVAIALLGFVLYMVFESALVDPVVRLVLLVTAAVAAAILGVAAVTKRARQEKEWLISEGKSMPPDSVQRPTSDRPSAWR